MTLLEHMHVGTCAHCKLPVTEADSWSYEGPEMGGYPPTVPVYHSSCQAESLSESLAQTKRAEAHFKSGLAKKATP